MSSLQRVALITGANRGLGLEMSRQLAALGITVLMAGRNSASIHAAARGLSELGLPVQPVVLDVTNPEQVASVRDRIQAGFGRLDILINNAAIITGESLFENSSCTVSTDALRSTFEVNLFAVVSLTQALLPLLEAAPAGRIVNMSSVLGSLATHRDFDGQISGIKPLAYDASKAALNMFTVHLAAALRGSLIKVNSAHPGWVKTDMGTEAAPMEVVDGAKTGVALALLGEDGPTGQFIHLGDALPW